MKDRQRMCLWLGKTHISSLRFHIPGIPSEDHCSPFKTIPHMKGGGGPRAGKMEGRLGRFWASTVHFSLRYHSAFAQWFKPAVPLWRTEMNYSQFIPGARNLTMIEHLSLCCGVGFQSFTALLTVSKKKKKKISVVHHHTEPICSPLQFSSHIFQTPPDLSFDSIRNNKGSSQSPNSSVQVHHKMSHTAIFLLLKPPLSGANQKQNACTANECV